MIWSSIILQRQPYILDKHLPIVNDSYSPGTMFPGFSYFSRNTILHQPLTGVDGTEQYMNLGSAWYVVRAYSKDHVTLITGILIKTDFPLATALLSPRSTVLLNCLYTVPLSP